VPPGRPVHSSAHALSRSHRSQNRRPRMSLIELDHALRKLRLSGMAAVLEARLRHAQTREADADRSRVRRAPASAGPVARAAAQIGGLSRSAPVPRQL
jgi:hypothetical protein